MSTDQAIVQYRDIQGFSGYRVGDDGSVWSSRRKGNKRDRGDWKRVSLYRRPYGVKYVVVCMRAEPNGTVSCHYVHRLVLKAFVGPCPKGQWAAHNDGNTENNSLTNLRWDTPANNCADKKRHGRWYKKVNETIIAEICSMKDSGVSTSDIAAKFTLNPSTVLRRYNAAKIVGLIGGTPCES